MSPSSSAQLVFSSLPTLLSGAVNTIALICACLSLGMVIGVLLALVNTYGTPLARRIAGYYDRVFRGFPALVLLFLFYFGLGGIRGFSLSPFLAAVLALGLRSAAYQAHIYRGSVLAVGEGQMSAARSLGMTKRQAIWAIIVPQAFHFSLPGMSNEYSILLKDTALAFAVGVVELMNKGKFIAVRTRATLPIYLAVAGLYLILTYIGIYGFSVLENRTSIPGLGTTYRRTRR